MHNKLRQISQNATTLLNVHRTLYNLQIIQNAIAIKKCTGAAPGSASYCPSTVYCTLFTVHCTLPPAHTVCVRGGRYANPTIQMQTGKSQAGTCYTLNKHFLAGPIWLHLISANLRNKHSRARIIIRKYFEKPLL